MLLIDAGNTRIKWALLFAEGTGLRAPDALGQWAVSGSAARGDVAQLADAWRGLKFSRVLISNVAGAALGESLELVLSQAQGLRPVAIEWFRSVPVLAGLRNAYRDPAQLGCDRFAAAIGARALLPDQALIVATCGTATTIDAITADGVFSGGMILPGLGLMAASLARNTAQLPQIARLESQPTPFADNTDDAIAAGCMAAQAGAIERAVMAHAAHVEQSATRPSGSPVQCIISGGAAALVAPHLSIPSRTVDNLVLIGLQAVVMQARPEPNPNP